MKFGLYLSENKEPGWEAMYVDYDYLKKVIKSLQSVDIASPKPGVGTSLSVARPTNAAGVPAPASNVTQESFFTMIEDEMKKIETFTAKMVADIRATLQRCEQKDIDNMDDEALVALQHEVDEVAENFLKLEKFVNLNFTAFHKILKKHDKRLPNPCKAFYINRLHDQRWVRGDYSDIIVKMSSLYSSIRGDEEAANQESEKQDFVRSTTKYWVHTENISRVKYIVLQHLPVFLQKDMLSGETDAQLVNSVYLDNRKLELYHGRLDKTPGAIALRMRWYGTSTPETVFVERKTHRESWAGEVSVKERFIVNETQVPSILRGDFDLRAEQERMAAKGKSEQDIADYSLLVEEVKQAINSKQLEPTMRTQYMRTAFQIPFDATVRVSLDTNLCMICERTEEVISGSRWYRDPSTPVPKDEITRFPHAVLEIKLQLEGENSTPEWVTELIESGMLMQVHKFSKFIHGCATLMPEDVQAVPYWIDDPTLASSIISSGAAHILEKPTGANQHYSHLIPHGKDGKPKVQPPKFVPRTPPSSQTGVVPTRLPSEDLNRDDTEWFGCMEYECFKFPQSFFCCEWATEMDDHMKLTPQKVEPKLFFANERTFVKWLHMAVMLSAASTGVLAFSPTDSQVQIYALILLPIALLFIVYPLNTYLWRSSKIRNRDSTRWDDPMGPVIITILLIFALCIQFVLKIMQCVFGY